MSGLFSLVYRNNLTVVDALIVSGRGASSYLYVREELQFRDESQANMSTLKYEIHENSLGSCSLHGSSTSRLSANNSYQNLRQQF